jgi:hypothetical protein
MKKKLKNIQMDQMINSLQKVLSHRDKIGYYAARNYRILNDSLVEYQNFKNSLISKYGTTDVDTDGNELQTISIKVGSQNFDDFLKELEPFNNIEHEVELMIAKYEDAIGCLSGEEILAIDWMLED